MSGGARVSRAVIEQEVLVSKFSRWFGAAAAGSLLVTGTVGCVSPKEYNNVKAERDAALLQRDVARAQAQGNKAEAEVYKAQVGMLSNADEGKDLRITALSNESAELRNQLAEVNARYTETMSSDSASSGASVGGNLPASLMSELAAFAGKHSGVCEFDSAKGVIRFKSDACFAPGSADLNEKGKATAKALATLLASKDGAGFELMVAGHTDATPISKSTTIKAGNKDNWFLSAHRAIAVGETLRDNHVHPRRLAMVGYADQRPVASNATESGRAANRRVEVLVMPVKLSAKELAAAPTSGSKSSASAATSSKKTGTSRRSGGRNATADARDLGFNK
jgi:flagellar motor protein MotB